MPERTQPVWWRGQRRWVVFGLIATFVICGWALDLRPSGLLPDNATRWDRAGQFFSAALTPAFDYRDENVPDDAPHIWVKGLIGLFLTLKYALGAMSVAVPLALVFGFLGSAAWWPERPGLVVATALRVLFVTTRFVMSLVRSIHELIWALLILSAFGVSPLAGMLALALPFSGTLGKVFSELIDEEARGATEALRAIGLGPIQTFLVGIFPAVLPNLVTYAFYRFECALRSSAVLGFVGIETIGLYIELSHEEGYYNEVWTYLYLLLGLIIAVDFWGAAIRKHLHVETEGSRA
ncbi:MAG: ABC transporter permease subunit [Verrucomicrobiota bacterium]